MSSVTYKVDVYDVNGAYITTLSSATMGPFQRVLNSGDSTCEITVALPYKSSPQFMTIGNEFQIFETTAAGEQKVFSGYIYRVRRQANSNRQITLSLVSFAGRLQKTFLMGPGDTLKITRNGTFSTDPGGLDSGKASDQMKFIVNMYRHRNASAAISFAGSDASIGFGSTTRLSQSFTTGTDAEQNAIVGVVMRMAYNTGTTARIDVAIRADDGTGKPTGANLALGRIVNGALISTSLRSYNVYFDTPLTLSNSTKYHIVVASSSASATNTFFWRSQDASNGYSGGDRVVSTDSGGTWTVQTNKDHWFKTLYVDESRVRLNYTSTSIDTSADDKDWVYTAVTCRQAMDYVLRYGPADWNFYIDANNTVHYHPSGFAKASILDNCDSSSGWSSGSDVASITTITQTSTASTVNNLPNRKEGAGSVSFALGGTATNHYIQKSISSTDLSAYTNAGCWVLVPATTQLADLRIRLYSGANYSEWAVNPATITLGAWNWLTPMVLISTTPTGTSGTLNKAAVDKIALVINTVASAETTTWYMDDWKAGNITKTSLVMGRDIADLVYTSSIEDLINRLIFSNNATSNPIQNSYQDLNSINQYLTSEANRVDGRITVEATMDAIGNEFISRNAYPDKVLDLVIPRDSGFLDAYGLTPNQLIRVVGLDSTLDFGNIYFVLTNVNYDGLRASLEVREIGNSIVDRVSEAESKLDMLQSLSASTGDTPQNTVFDE